MRLSRVPADARAEVQQDLAELFEARLRQRGAAHAHWRLYRDIASLWAQPTPDLHRTPRPAGFATFGGAAAALLRDTGGDLRYAARLFARQPATLLLAIGGLALGLGIATAAFSIMNAALGGEGLADPDRAPGILRTTGRSVATEWTYDEFRHLRAGATRLQVEGVLTDAAVARIDPAETDAPSAALAFVSGGFFSATGARLAAGRPLEPVDEAHAGPPPVVVSFAFWTARLDGDPRAVGRTIHVGRTPATIVGVAADGFSVPSGRLLWMPLTAYGAVFDARRSGDGAGAAPVSHAPIAGLQVFGRLLPGVERAEAEAQLTGVAASLPRDRTTGTAVGVRLDPHAGLGRLPAADTVAIVVLVFAAIGLVLLLACANTASVLVATAIAREREMGVRAALGASRWRIVRQLLTESLALGTVAAAAGLLFAWWTIPLVATMIEAPATADVTADLNVYLFLGLVTLFSGVGAGLAPAWHGRGSDLVAPLKGDGARPNRIAPRRLRSMLVATQAAVSVVLIVLATLFVRATFRVSAIDVGFDTAGLYAVSPPSANASADGGAGVRAFWARAIPELQAIPGIATVTLAERTPFDGITRTSTTRGSMPRVVEFTAARAEFFEALGLRILAGRTFTREEVAAGSPVAVVSESVARTYWPDRSPLGHLLPAEIPIAPALSVGPDGPALVTSPRPQVIGVVGDVVAARLHERAALAIYDPLHPGSEPFAHLLVRVAPGATGAIQLASQRLRAIDPQSDIRIASIAARLEQEAGRPRVLALLTGFVGAIAILLCVIGLYGLTASVVGQRAREMSVRAALGADRGDLRRLLMRDSLKPVVVGLAVGAAAGLAGTRLAGSAVFFGVAPQDPFAYAGAIAVLLAAAALAVLLPARRAAAADAALVLRQS
jgi:predicted permease